MVRWLLLHHVIKWGVGLVFGEFFVFVFMIEILLAEWKGKQIMTTKRKKETILLLQK